MKSKCKICGCVKMMLDGPICRECLISKYHAKKIKYHEAVKKRYKGNEELRIAKIKDTWDKKSGNIIIAPSDPFLSPRCKCGKNPETEDHPCPFNAELNNDSETMCNCCDDCCQQCADDI